MSRVSDILERHNAPHNLAAALQAEASDALTAEMIRRAGSRDRHPYFTVQVKYNQGGYDLHVRVPSAATGTREHQASLAIVAELCEKEAGSFRTTGIDFPHGRPKKGAEAIHAFRAENIGDIVTAVNRVLGEGIAKIDPTPFQAQGLAR